MCGGVRSKRGYPEWFPGRTHPIWCSVAGKINRCWLLGLDLNIPRRVMCYRLSPHRSRRPLVYGSEPDGTLRERLWKLCRRGPAGASEWVVKALPLKGIFSFIHSSLLCLSQPLSSFLTSPISGHQELKISVPPRVLHTLKPLKSWGNISLLFLI